MQSIKAESFDGSHLHFVDAISGGNVVDAGLSAPILETHGLAGNRYEPSIPSIQYLLQPSRPSTVIFGIAKVVVLSVESKPLRWMSHVFEEVLERLKPSLTDSYSALAVILGFRCHRVVATVLHRLPALVGGCPRHPMNKPLLVLDAATRLHASLFEVISAHCSRLATITNAIPVGAGMLKGSVNHPESPMNLTGPINSPEGHFVTSVGVLC